MILEKEQIQYSDYQNYNFIMLQNRIYLQMALLYYTDPV